MCKTTSFLMALLGVLALPIPLAQSQTVTRVTRDNIKQLHAKFSPEMLAAAAATTTTTTTEPSEVKIGVFYAIMWTNGQAMYEFDYTNCAGITGPDGCNASNAYHYTGNIEFTDAIVYAAGTSQDWAASGQGPINTDEYLGIAFGGDTSPFNCNPLTEMGVEKVVKGDTIYSYQSSCIDIALQLISGAPTNTFTLLDGSSYIAYGISNTFITPKLGNVAIYSYCDADDFCGSQAVVPVYMHRVPQSD
jgi:hypothetical protein